MSVKTTGSLWSRRKILTRVALGSVTGFAMVACGGGGGGNDSNGSDLRAAYDKIAEGMTEAEVISIVGRSPQSISSDHDMYWSGGGQVLHVRIRDDLGIVYWKRWDRVSPSETLRVNYF